MLRFFLNLESVSLLNIEEINLDVQLMVQNIRSSALLDLATVVAR